MKFTSSQSSRAHYNPTMIYFTSLSKNLTQFVKVLLIKFSDMLHSSNFIRFFHRQSFTLYHMVAQFKLDVFVCMLVESLKKSNKKLMSIKMTCQCIRITEAILVNVSLVTNINNSLKILLDVNLT